MQNLHEEGCSKKVGRDFNCSRNELETLKGCSKIIGDEDFDYSPNQLKTLEYGPEKVKDFHSNVFEKRNELPKKSLDSKEEKGNKKG